MTGQSASQEQRARELDALLRERETRERIDRLVASVLDLVSAAGDTPTLLQDIVTLLARETGFDAIGLRLREGRDFPYYQTRGMSEAFVRLENSLCPRHPTGQPVDGDAGDPSLECVCGMVIENRLDRRESFVTAFGSFWTNDSAELTRLRPELLAQVRGGCIDSGYRCAALVPLRFAGTTHGLLQFEDRRPGLLTSQMMRGLELVARHLALALSQRQVAMDRSASDGDLEQRVRERTRQLAESEMKFRVLANTMPQLAWIAQADGYISWYNDPWYAYTGTTPEQMEGWGWQRVHDPDSLPAVLEKWQSSIASGRPFDMVFPLRGADGRFRPFLTRVNPMVDAAGNVIRWFGTNTDISEQKALEAELREREDQLRLFIEFAPAAIAMFDNQMRYLAVSRRWLDDFGLDGQDCLGRNHYDLFPEIPERWKAIHRRCLSGAVERAEEDPFERADGRTQWLRWEIRPWRAAGGTIGGLLVFSEDVTARRQSRQELLERAVQFKKVFQASPVPMAIADYAESRLVQVNDAYLHLTGYSREEMIGKNSLELGIWHDPQTRQWIRERFAAGERIVDAEVLLHNRSGGVINVLLSIEAMEMDKRLHMLVVAKDITERKRAEDRLRHSRDALEDRFKERTRELEIRSMELENLTFITTHDLQEPLRKVRVFGERLRLEYAAALGDTGRDYLRRMEKAATRLQSLINDLLHYAQLSSGGSGFTFVDLGGIAREAAFDFAHTLTLSGGTIEIADLPRAEVDTGQLRQVFQNLFSNALKFHGALPPKVVVRGEILMQNGRELVRLWVQDNGIGFDQHYKEKVFVPFQRLHGRNDYDGTGIGLAIVRKIVDRHKGTVSVTSEPGVGSCFELILPRKQSV